MRLPIPILTCLLLATACSSGSGTPDASTTAEVLHDGSNRPGDGRTEADAVADALGDGGADTTAAPQTGLWEHVDPMIGTGGLSYRLGSVFVGASMPFGMTKVGPDTKHIDWGEPGFTHCEGYWYPDTHVAGFSQLHIHGTGAPDYGVLLVQPTYGMTEDKVTETGYMLPLNHDKEHAEPAYYKLTMGNPPVVAELTATTRVGMHRFTFQETDEAVVLVDPSHVIASCDVTDTEITIDKDQGTIEGWLHTGCSLSGRFGGFTMYFHGRFTAAATDAGVWQDDLLSAGAMSATGPETGAWFQFVAAPETPIEFAMGISFVDLQHARDNLELEVSDADFDEVLAGTRDTWDAALGRGKAIFPDDTPEDVRIQYYTSLYHAMLMPTIWSDNDGSYIAFDDTIKNTDGHIFYTDFSMWDTYRTLHPLLFMLYPDRSADMVMSLLEMARIHQCIPKWVLANGDGGSMIGRPGTIVVADAWLSSLPIDDEQWMYETMLHSHGIAVEDETVPECAADDGMMDYIQYGYHPSDKHGGSVSKTQEIAWADYCVGRVAEAMGSQTVAQDFFKRSLNPYNLYNEELGFFHAKDSVGNWLEKFNAFFWADHFTEGNAWQYLWLVPHDPAGLAELLGGTETFFARLDEFFDETEAWDNPVVPPQHYFQGNEPDIHAPFLYSALGRPASSAKWSRWIMDKEFYVDPEGLAGNDDAGTMAAWYAFATLGFYPVPCTGRYLLGSPRVKEAWLNSFGNPLHIVVEGASEAKPYIKSVTWDGQPVETPWFTIEQLKAGGEVVFTMSEEPTQFGTAHAVESLAELYQLQ